MAKRSQSGKRKKKGSGKSKIQDEMKIASMFAGFADSKLIMIAQISELILLPIQILVIIHISPDNWQGNEIVVTIALFAIVLPLIGFNLLKSVFTGNGTHTVYYAAKMSDGTIRLHVEKYFLFNKISGKLREAFEDIRIDFDSAATALVHDGHHIIYLRTERGAEFQVFKSFSDSLFREKLAELEEFTGLRVNR